MKRRAKRFIANTYPLLLLDLVAERGVEPSKVLEGTGIDRRLLESPDAHIAASHFARMAGNAMRLTGDEGLACDMGLRTRPTLHGFLGYAVMTARNMREVIDVALRFQNVRQQHLTFDLSTKGDQVLLRLRERRPLGPLRHFFHEMTLIGFARVAGFLLRETFLRCEIWFDWPKPPYFARYESRLPPARFDRSFNQICFSMAEFEREPIMADPVAFRQAVEHCERELLLTSTDDAQLAVRVTAILGTSRTQYPNLEQVATRLRMSARSLERKLRAEGTSFQTILDERRREEALRLLEESSLEVKQIAALLGYSEPANFTRAFRKWCGMTPRAYRAR